MSGLQLGNVAQALITDPLTGSASGYSLVGYSPGLARADAESLVQQPLVTDYLHLLAEKRSFFAFHPLPSGAWALTRRFLHGRRRGAFNRVVVHALVLPPAVLDALPDPPLALRSGAALGASREPWVRLGDRLIEEGSLGGPPLPLPDLALEVPADLETQRIAGILDQREHLLASWGEEPLRLRLGRSFAALAQGRLLLDQGPQEEQFLGLLFSLLPWRDRRRLAFTTHLPVEALGAFRLAAIEAPEQVLARLPPGHGSFGLAAEPPRAGHGGAEALTGLFFDRGLLERWLATERAGGASLWDDDAGLARQVAELLRASPRYPQLAAALLSRLEEIDRAAPPAVLERLLGSPAAASPERFARELLGQLSRDPGRRLAEGLGLLRRPDLSERARWLLEDVFLARLLDEAGEELRRAPPGFAEVAAAFGLDAQLILARALGRTGATEFLGGALRAGRMDLAGFFLRAAGRDFFRGLRGAAHRELVVQLKKAWARPAHRLDLMPWGAAIGRLEEGS